MGALVLVADHDPFNLRLLHEACEAAGYDVVTAAVGPEVLTMVARQPPDLLLLDCKMPQLDGFEVLRILKADINLQEIPVVLITDADDVDARGRGIKLGAEDYLTRPYRVFEIQQRCAQCIACDAKRPIGVKRKRATSQPTRPRHRRRHALTTFVEHRL